MPVRRCSSTVARKEKDLDKREAHVWDSTTSRRFLDSVVEDVQLSEEQKSSLGEREALAARWRRISNQLVIEKGGRGLLRLHGNSLYATLVNTYPERRWEAHEVCGKVPKGYWDSWEHRRAFMDSVKATNGIERIEEWSTVGREAVAEMGGAGLLAKFGNSLHRLLVDTYREESITVRQVQKSLPRNHWSVQENCRKFMEDFMRKKGIREKSHWRSVTVKDISAAGGQGLLSRFNCSVIELLRFCFPEEEWREEEVRAKRSQSYWDSRENRIAMMTAVAKKHNVEKLSDWDRVTTGDIVKEGGSALLNKRSVRDLIRELYPDTEADAILFRKRLPANYWADRQNVRSFLDMAREKLSIRSKEDWYRISHSQVKSLRGSGLLNQMGLVDALRFAYPDEEWKEPELLSHTKRSAQRELRVAACTLLPEFDVVENHRDSRLLTPQGISMELDIFFPSLNFALEYNGRHHYEELGFFGAVEEYVSRDEKKAKLCREHGIRLLVVPYWWDKTAGSLLATIYEEIPSVLEESGARDKAELSSLFDALQAGQLSRIPHAPVTVQRQRISESIVAGDPTGMLLTPFYGGAVAASARDGHVAMRRTGKLLQPSKEWLRSMHEALEGIEVDGVFVSNDPRSSVPSPLTLTGGKALNEL